jgi:hypothetical protein
MPGNDDEWLPIYALIRVILQEVTRIEDEIAVQEKKEKQSKLVQ